MGKIKRSSVEKPDENVGLEGTYPTSGKPKLEVKSVKNLGNLLANNSLPLGYDGTYSIHLRRKAF